MRMNPKEFGDLLIVTWECLRGTSWHWSEYHFNNGPLPFAMSILETCATIDRRAPGTGTKLLRELLAIGGIQKHEPHYEQLLQKLAEFLVIERIVTAGWPEGSTFEHEPAAVPGGPRPELLVTYPGGRLAVEVKTPSLLQHIRQRGQNGTQLTYRGGLPLEHVREHLGSDGVTLPRDNPVRDFLVDADRKFVGFRDSVTATLLVIVWDDYIYEPISVLVNAGSGLLTTNSFERDESGRARTYPNVDIVVALRHLNYFIAGSREELLVDRKSAMDFGSDHALPNVFFDVSGRGRVPTGVLAHLRAFSHNDPGLKKMAEYNVTDMVFWS